MFTIIVSIIAASAIIVCGLLYKTLLEERSKHKALSQDHEELESENQGLRTDLNNLRMTNRVANKHASAESRRLRNELRAARTHAEEIQEFHLHNERELHRQLAGAHALIEMLLDRIPKTYQVAINHPEAHRLFAPLVEMTKKIDRAEHNQPFVF
jgi:hypothetical protein